MSSSTSTSQTILEQARHKMNYKTKPFGSLGILETIGIRLADIQQTLEPTLARKRMCVYAGSHGIAAEGVSAYPTTVTVQMVMNFLNGGAASNVLTRHGGIELHVIDVGVDAVWSDDLAHRPGFFCRKVRRGTRSFSKEPAMTADECTQALEAGREQVRLAVADGIHVLGIGEKGIGNTTSAAAVFTGLLGLSAEETVGRGTGINDSALQHKIRIVSEACAKYSQHVTEPAGFYWLQHVGGYEIAAMAGTILEAGRARMPLVVDGYISTAAAAAAFSIEPSCRDVCFFSHRSDEQAHGKILQKLGVEALLDLKLRLGEGSGAALGMHIMEAGAKILCEMASFESAGVSMAIQDLALGVDKIGA